VVSGVKELAYIWRVERYRSIVSDNARWEGFTFRDGDIVISTPPKCGTTWTQMICALLIFRTDRFDKSIDLISPWLDMTTRALDSVLADLDAQTHRRFIKTHTPLDGLPFDGGATYITAGRDPRDVAMSEAHHFDNMDMDAFIGLIDAAVGLDSLADVLPTEIPQLPESMRERFWLWTQNVQMPGQSISGLPATLHHLDTFWQKRNLDNVVLLHYDDLKDDLPGQMLLLARRLGIEIDEDEVRALARAATFDSMRSRATEVAPNTSEPIWRDATNFFHSGTSGQWREVLTDEDIRRYAALVAELAPPDLIEWVHRGPVAT
jgi:aryl sulfotransferase